jgi:hypothetical protein
MVNRFISSDKTRVPTHKSMENARLGTFKAGDGWVHDKVKNHGASSKVVSCTLDFANFPFSLINIRWPELALCILLNKPEMILRLAYTVTSR